MPTPKALTQVVALPNCEAVSGVVSAALYAALDDWIAPTAADFVNLESEWEDNGEEINGQVLPTEYTLVQKSSSLARKYNLSTETAAWLLALQLQDVTSSSASAAVNEVQKLTITGTLTAGGYALGFNGAQTLELPFNVTDAAMTAALEALPTVGAGNVAAVLAAGVYTLTFANDLAARDVPIITVQITTPLVGGSIAMSVDTEGSAAGVYTHEIRWPDPCILNPATTALAELLKCAGSLDTYKLYKFLAVNAQSFELNGKSKIAHTADLMGDGTETPIPGFVPPAYALPVTRLYGSMSTVSFGTTAPAAPITTNTLRTLKIGIASDLQIPPNISSVTHITELQVGEGKPDLTIEFQVKGDKSSPFWAARDASEYGQRYFFEFLLNPHSPEQRRMQLNCSQVLVSNVEPTAEGNENRLNVTIMCESNPTDEGPGVWTVETGIPAYLVPL